MKKLNRQDGKPTDSFKASSKPKTEKIYATFDDELWNEKCASNSYFKEYRPSTSDSDPFNSKERDLSLISKYRLDNTNNIRRIFFGLSGENFYSNLYIYKINRLIDLVEIYTELYAYSEVPKTSDIQAMEDPGKPESAAASLHHLKTRNNNFWWNINSKQDLYTGMHKLSKLVELYEKNETFVANEKAKEFRLCSAIYEAENEYR